MPAPTPESLRTQSPEWMFRTVPIRSELRCLIFHSSSMARCAFSCKVTQQSFTCHGIIYLLTNLLTHSMEQVLLNKPTGFQLLKEFPAFYGIQRFITTFTSARHLSLSWASSIQSIPPHPISWRSILILSSHPCLGLPSGLFPSGFPIKTLNTPLLFPIHATCPAHLMFQALATWGWRSSVNKNMTLNILSIYESKRLGWSTGSVLAFSTQVCGFKPSWSCRTFRVKKSSARLPSEGK